MGGFCVYVRDAADQFMVGLPFKTALVTIFGLLCGIADDMSPAIRSLIVLMFVDLVLGVARALHVKPSTFSFRRMGDFLRKCFLYLGAIYIAHLVDVSIGAPFSIPGFGTVCFVGTLCAGLAVHEGLSCMEHLTAFGLRIPWFTKKLNRYKHLVESDNYMGPDRRKAAWSNTPTAQLPVSIPSQARPSTPYPTEPHVATNEEREYYGD
jgi:phage-related holin